MEIKNEKLSSVTKIEKPQTYSYIGEIQSSTKSNIDNSEILNNGLKIESLRGKDLSPEEINEISDFYLEIFRNEPYSQFLFDKQNPLKAISPQEFFNSDKKYFSLEEMENIEMPEGYAYWMEKEKTRNINKIRLNENSYITKMINEKTGQIVGFVFGRRATLQEIFETEEIKNPILLSNYFDENILADEDTFYEKMKYHCNIDKNDEVFYISGMGVTYLSRTFDNFYALMNNFGKNISKKDLNIPSFAEIESGSTSHDILQPLSDKEIFGILNNGHPIIYSEKFETFCNFFIGEKKYLLGKIKKYKKLKKN